MRTSSEDTALSLLQEAAPAFVCTRSVATAYPHIAQHAAAGTDLNNVVAAADFAVAETGSVGINEPADDRGRCFLAERLWLLVPESALVPSLDEALQRIGERCSEARRTPF